MLWYLLYPFRGTTSPPDLTPDHPLRRAFARYGVAVAHNVAITLLVSVAVATALIYPIPFLYSGGPDGGAPSLPQQVWTNAQPIKEGVVAEPDVIMRSFWVHGSYMKALEHDVLLGALDLQDRLLGSTIEFCPGCRGRSADDVVLGIDAGPDSADLSPAQRDALHIANGLSNQSWFFHSPLLYWPGGRDALWDDADILATVNERKRQPTAANVTLRHSVVFSGKRFEHGMLVAADALVVTLIHMRDSAVGRQWERKVAQLMEMAVPAESGDGAGAGAGTGARIRVQVGAGSSRSWTVYPANIASLSSQLYEFQFLPISWQDSAMLALAYSLTLLYVAPGLARVPAIKSRPGLILTVMAQMLVSVLSSLTVCSLWQIDLSHIPRAAFPLVIVSMSLENMLRLIRAVIATDLEHSTSTRMGEALGKTAHVALTSVAEHLLLLWIISQLVTAGLSGFCAFLAIAVVFDVFYLFTLFLSVLSIEVRRTELSDVIEKAAQRRILTAASPTTTPTPAPTPASSSPWRLSTRIAGSIILLGFVAIAQLHFFDNAKTAGRRLWSLLVTLVRLGAGNSRAGGYSNLTTWAGATSHFADVHQARDPTSWLRLQDHDTAREIIRAVKPGGDAHSYVARVYEPLVFVTEGADRSTARAGGRERSSLLMVYDLWQRQWRPFVVTVAAVAAAVCVFVNYLVRGDEEEAAAAAAAAEENEKTTVASAAATDSRHSGAPPTDVLSVQTLDQGHLLDVALLTASPDGLVVSVGLDRRIRVWNMSLGGVSYLVAGPAAASEETVPFPVRALAIDPNSTWLAILSTCRVMLWHLEKKVWGPSMVVDLGRPAATPEALFFAPSHNGRSSRLLLVPSLVMVRRDGTLVELWTDRGASIPFSVCKSPLVCAVPYGGGGGTGTDTGDDSNECKDSDTRILLAASRSGCVHRVTPVGDGWMSEEIRQQADRAEKAQAIVPLPRLAAFLVVRPHTVELVDLAASTTVHTFITTTAIRPRSLRCLWALDSRRPGLKRTRPGAPGASSTAAAELSYFSLVYTSAATAECVVQTYLPQHTGGSIVFAGTRGHSLDQARLVVRRVPSPGPWEALPSGGIIGVRLRSEQTAAAATPASASEHGASYSEAPVYGPYGSYGKQSIQMRRRGAPAAAAPKAGLAESAGLAGQPEGWEVWAVTDVGRDDRDGDGDGSDRAAQEGPNYVTRPLVAGQGDLLVAEPGPMVLAGAGTGAGAGNGTVALALGTSVKIITLGGGTHGRLSSAADLLEAAAAQLLQRRRRHRTSNSLTKS